MENIKEDIEMLIKDGKINAALRLAVNGSDPEMIFRIVGIGADVNASRGCSSCLVSAVKNKNTEVIKAVISVGANVNEVLFDGRTLLMYFAEESPNPEIIKILMDSGADINVRDKAGKSALDYANEENKKVLEFYYK